MNSCEFTMSITAIANAIANRFDNDTVELLGAAFTQLGDTLSTIAARRNLCQKRSSTLSAVTSSDDTDSAQAQNDVSTVEASETIASER